MPRILVRLALWLAGVFVLAALLVGLLAATLGLKPELAAGLLEKLAAWRGVRAEITGLALTAFPPSLAADNLRIFFAKDVSAQASGLRIELDPAQVLGDGAWLRLVRADSISIFASWRPPAQSAPAPAPSFPTWLLIAQQVSLKKLDLNLALPSGRLVLAGADLEISRLESKQRSLGLTAQAAWRDPAGRILLRARLGLQGGIHGRRSLSARFTIQDGALNLPWLTGRFQGGARLKMDAQGLALSELDLELPGLQARTPDGFRMSARVSGSLALKNSPEKGCALAGLLRVKGSCQAGDIKISDFILTAPLAGTLRALASPSLALTLPAGAMRVGNRPLPLKGLTLKGALSLGDDGVVFQKLILDAQGLGNLTGFLALKNNMMQGTLAGRLGAPGLIALVNALAPADSAWSGQGVVSLKAAIKGPVSSPGVNARLRFNGLGLNSGSGLVMMEGLSGGLDLDLARGPAPLIKARLDLSQGQALWGAVFLDLAAHPLQASLAGRLKGARALEGVSLDATWKPFGRLEAGGALDWSGAPGFQAKLSLTNMDLGAIFNVFLRDPLSVSRPDLAAYKVAGRAKLDLNVAGRGGSARLSGRLGIKEASLENQGGGLSLGGLNLDLPLSYVFGQAPPTPPKPVTTPKDWGRLGAARLRLGQVALDNLGLEAALVPNRLLVRGAVLAPLLGGRLKLDRIEVERPLSPDYQARFRLALTGLDLSQAELPAPIKGSLSGELAPVVLSRRSLAARGLLRARVFGGALEMQDIRVEHPFDPGREFAADISARGLDLAPLSASLGIGKITGRLNADLKNLRIAYGQPIAFDLSLESVPTAGVSQVVSLKAVNTISVLGTGSGLTGLGVSFFAGFFRQFPYQKIGLACTLNNDEFRVKGLIKDGGMEYLVKRPALMGINVINRNPDNRISFSDMLDRLRRVRRDNQGSKQ